jgi:hypothetical protein
MVGTSDHTCKCAHDMTQDGNCMPGRLIMWLESWDFGLCDINPTSGEERRGELELEFYHTANESVNHASVIKPNEIWAWKLGWASWLVIPWYLGGWCIPRTQSSTWDPFRPCPLGLFFWLVPICILYNKTIVTSINTFLSSASHFSELSNLRQ